MKKLTKRLEHSLKTSQVTSRLSEETEPKEEKVKGGRGK
jgi:hypothetical protein